jgi:glycosyltransferase involved in cell wall biosynthesis
MKISIVTISFNQAKYLRQCIESILGQVDCDLEYIVVDPGSTDGSREIIESYGDRIVRVFERDSGPADGLNKGFSLATGAIFGFINSDDYLLPKALQKVTQFFCQKNLHRFMTGQGFVELPTGELKIVRPSTLNLTNMLHRSAVIFQQATFFPADAFVQAQGFNINNKTCWDYELFIRFLLNGLVHEVSPENLAVFKLHADSISGSGRFTANYLKELDQIFLKVLGRPRNFKDAVYTKILGIKRKIAGVIN